MLEQSIDIRRVQEIRSAGKVYFGCGAIDRIAEIAAVLKRRGVDSVLVVTGKNAYKSTGAWDKVEKALAASGIQYALYDRITPNPTTVQVDEAARLGRKTKAKAVIAIGGGSPIDAGKSAAILLDYPTETAAHLYEYQFIPEHAVPIAAINLTHGTGTEVNRFAVVTLPDREYKPAIAYDCIYPTWAIDDPELMTGLAPEQTRFVSIDAVNHAVEAATSKIANPYSVTLAAETIRLVARYLPRAMADSGDLEARYFLLYASLLGGISFDNSLLHFTHALEHPLSAVKPDLSHGLGLAVLLPAVVRRVYPALPERMAALLAPLAPGLAGEPGEADLAAAGVAAWLCDCGVPQKLDDVGFSVGDLDKLVRLTFETPSLPLMLSMAPVEADSEAVRAIFSDSFRK